MIGEVAATSLDDTLEGVYASKLVLNLGPQMMRTLIRAADPSGMPLADYAAKLLSQAVAAQVRVAPVEPPPEPSERPPHVRLVPTPQPERAAPAPPPLDVNGPDVYLALVFPGDARRERICYVAPSPDTTADLTRAEATSTIRAFWEERCGRGWRRAAQRELESLTIVRLREALDRYPHAVYRRVHGSVPRGTVITRRYG